MLKYLFIILNSLAIFLYSMLRDDLDIITGFPNKVTAGETFNAEITIFKGSLRKFGKLELIFPPGFTVEVTDPKAADFNFIGNKATFLWSYLPAEEEFTVSFKVTTSSAVSGRKVVKSNFYYVENNLKEVLEIDPVEIKVKNEGIPAQDDAIPIAKNKNKLPEIKDTIVKDTSKMAIAKIPEAVTSAIPETNTNIPVSNNTTQQSNAAISATRTVSEGSTKGEYKVVHKLNKSDLSGFGKIEDLIPEGYAAANDKGAGSSYTFNNNKVRYVWVVLPKEKEIEVSYFLRKTGTPTTHDISGTFDYLKNNETQSINIGNSQIPHIDDNTVVSNQTRENKVEPIVKKEKAKPTDGALTGYRPNAKKTPIPSKKNPTLNTQTVETPISGSNTNDEFTTKSAAPVDTTAVVKSGESATPINSATNSGEEKNTNQSGITNKSSAKVNFSVQVAALQKQKEAASIQRYLALSDRLQIEFHEGYSKYVSGKFDEYLKAKTHRDKIRNNGKRRAFVTAYNTGKRITVQEGLMIANQQWYK
jgi:hypothetical protein